MANKDKLLQWFRDHKGESVKTHTRHSPTQARAIETPARKIKDVNGTRVRLESTVINFDEEDVKYRIDFISETAVQYSFLDVEGNEVSQVGYQLVSDR